jgi:CBS-domain-containing membrane protein
MSKHISSTSFKPLPSGAPLVYAAQILGNENLHAVPIVDPSGSLVRMVTQADIIRFLAQHVDELGPLGPMAVGDTGLFDPVESAKHLVIARFSDKAIDVLQQMRMVGAPAASVIDSYGAMAANISFSDVKAIAKRANFAALQLPLSQFFNAEKAQNAMNPSIYIKSSSRFESVVLTLAATKIHQLYFVDDALHPKGCVRIGDILRMLTKEEDS